MTIVSEIFLYSVLFNVCVCFYFGQWNYAVIHKPSLSFQRTDSLTGKKKLALISYAGCFLFELISFSSILSSELGGLLKYVRPFLNSISKAKAARLVRSLLDLFLDMEAATGQEVELCLECIEWAKAEKRTFLRQALEVRLGSVTEFAAAALFSIFLICLAKLKVSGFLKICTKHKL